MAYKVLGQTSATAAAASTTLNLVKDPIFNGISRTPAALGTNATNWTEIAGTQWYGQCTSSYQSSILFGDSNLFTQTYQMTGTRSKYGTKTIGISSTSTAGTYEYTYLAYGLAIGNGIDAGSLNSTRFGGPTRSIPVSASTTYYYGLEMLGSYINEGDSNLRVMWFDSNGSYLGQNNNSLTSASSNSWVKKAFSATSPSSAAYAGIQIQTRIYQMNQVAILFDGLYLGTDSSLSSTFPDPVGGTNLLLTPPFTSRYSSTWSGTANNSTTVANFAGAGVTLYTVPAGKSTVISTVTVANASTSSQTYRIAVVPSGETLAAKHWIVFDGTLSAFSTDAVTIGMTLAAGDSIVVSSDVTSTQFTAFGSES